jgi:hypothetical protein
LNGSKWFPSLTADFRQGKLTGIEQRCHRRCHHDSGGVGEFTEPHRLSGLTCDVAFLDAARRRFSHKPWLYISL